MVIIVRKTDNVVTWAFDKQLSEIRLTDKQLEVGDELIVMDMTSKTAEVYEIDSMPDDFEGGKYKYVNNEFELNTEY